MSKGVVIPDEVKVVWVDLDDTIIDFTTNAHSALLRMWNDEAVLRRYFRNGEAWAELYERHNMALWGQYNLGKISRDFLRMQRFLRPLTEAGMPESEAETVAKRYDTLYLDYLAQEKTLMPGGLDFMKRLRRSGCVIGCLSNGFKEVQFRKIENAGLKDYFDIVVLSDDIGVNKPDVRIYEYAMERVGDTDPKHHLMVGDNPLTDVQGAINAGWHAVWYHPERAFAGIACPEGATETAQLS